MATEAARLKRKKPPDKRKKNRLDTNQRSHGRTWPGAAHVRPSGNAGPAAPAKLEHPRRHSQRHHCRSRSGLPFASIRLSLVSLVAVFTCSGSRVVFVGFLPSSVGIAFLEEERGSDEIKFQFSQKLLSLKLLLSRSKPPKPCSDNPGGLSGSTQHLPCISSSVSAALISSADVNSNRSKALVTFCLRAAVQVESRREVLN